MHNITLARVLIELENRGLNIAPWGPLAIGAHVAKKFVMTRTRLRALLISRLQEEEELERLSLYAQDKCFTSDLSKTKHELGRVVVDMLHCPMRMNEKILFLLYYAVMKRCGGDIGGMKCALDEITTKVRLIGSLPDT